ncbi:MAG: DEAD/DEAH box helicase, partial [Bdellovibrionota bacterium]
VLDEADEMLNMGFFEDVQRIIEGANPNRNLWMFSATMPKQIKGLIEKSFRNPVFVNTKSKEVSNADIEQSYYLVKDKYKLNALTQVLDMIDNFYGVIFCQTRQETKDLGYTLMDQNYNVSVLHGDLSQAERSSAMRDFKKGKTKVLICTDVAARGIDVNNLTHVINFGLPRDKESYVHRIGRTGRAGNKGFAISILNREDIHRLKRIESLQKASIKREKFPEIRERKKIFIEKKTKKFDSLAYQLMQEQENYTVDEVFEQFNQRFDSFSKEDTLKMIFNSLFKNDLRRMDELSDIELDVADENRRSSRSTRGRDGGGRGRDRDRRRSRGRSRDGARDRDGGRERDRDSRPSRSRSERSAKSSDRSERRERGERKDSASFSSSKPKGDSRKSSKPKAKSGQKGSSFFTPGQKKKRKANESRSRSR